jgi:hypothetical protein
MISTTLKTEFEAKQKKAINSGRFFITITHVDPVDDKTLHHYYIRNEFPTEDILPSMKKLIKDIKRKENV